MATARRRVLISGMVQGVAFRAYTRHAAQQASVSGWVRNLPDGRVEAVFEGHADRVTQMVEWCRRGSPGSRVDRVDVIEEAPRGESSDFQITYVRGDYW
ncbi:MAG: acylphosphatase [Thermodesulfobacteriota bacterium]